MSNKPNRNDTLEGHLSRDQEITITTIGRKSGRSISLPVWFAWEDSRLYLLPVKGSDTQWYKNALKNPAIRVDAGGIQSELTAVTVTDAAQVQAVIEKFRGKYGASDVKKYYSKFDVAVIAQD
ncbi:MAG TPA: nitroreductase/quinone reductase family protein [Candidatus Angelobacter sp.]|nr:nitroreductase/quinone reductase family protein [Candidatus Angelobacter sp.]